MGEYFKGLDRKGDHHRGHDRGHNVETQDHPQKERTPVVAISTIAITIAIVVVAKAHAVGDRVLALGRHNQGKALHDRKAKGAPEFYQMVDGVVDGLVVLLALVVGFHVGPVDVVDKDQTHVDAQIDEAQNGENEIRVGRGSHVLEAVDQKRIGGEVDASIVCSCSCSCSCWCCC